MVFRGRASHTSPPLLLATGYALLLLSWGVANPPFAAPDEPAHYLRAIAVGGGSVAGEPTVEVPAGLWVRAETPACNAFLFEESAACLDRLQSTDRTTSVESAAGLYPPVAYFFPGLVARAASDPESADRAARLVVVASSALLLLLAAVLLWSPVLGLPSLVGLAVATTPMVLFVGSIVNNSALAVTAGVAFAAALLRVGRSPPSGTWVWVAVAATGSLLALGRSTGILWVLLDVGIVALFLGASRFGRIVRENVTAVLWTGATIGTAVIANRAWEQVYGTKPTQSGPLAVPWRDKVGEAFTELDRLAVEWVGQFGWLDSPIPTWATAAWLTLITGLGCAALAVGSWRQRLAVVLTFAVAVATAVVLSATLRAGELGGDVQARHVLPFLVLLPLLAGEITTRHRARIPRLDRLVPLALGVTAALHVVAWYWNARRHATGIDGQLLFLGDAEWSPPLGWALWLVVAALGAGLTAASAFVPARVPARGRHVVREDAAEPVISVVIPVKNGGADLARCLDAIAAQEVEDDVEVVVVDSGSTDGSPELARSRGARVHEIPAEEFQHGATRNLGASLARGETLVFTTQDAYAADRHWLARLVAAVRGTRVAGAYGRQVPHDGARPPERYFLDFVYGPEPRTQALRRPEELTFRETLFSNVSSAIRRSVWEKNPFPEDVAMSEDQAWSRRMLLSGWSIVYEPRAVVRHSHAYSLSGAFRRFFDSGASADRSFVGEAPESSRALRGAAGEYARGELAWLWRTGQRRWIPYAALYEGAKFVGLQLGLRHERLPRRLRERLGALPPPG